jgi:hypothetical protein
MVTFVDAHRKEHGVESICRVLPMAPSTYHNHSSKTAHPKLRSHRAKRDDGLRSEDRRVYEENFRVYGPRKVWRIQPPSPVPSPKNPTSVPSSLPQESNLRPQFPPPVPSASSLSGSHKDLWNQLFEGGSDSYPYPSSRIPTLVFDKLEWSVRRSIFMKRILRMFVKASCARPGQATATRLSLPVACLLACAALIASTEVCVHTASLAYAGARAGMVGPYAPLVSRRLSTSDMRARRGWAFEFLNSRMNGVECPTSIVVQLGHRTGTPKGAAALAVKGVRYILEHRRGWTIQGESVNLAGERRSC